MPLIRYEVVEHDGGWAYRLGDVYSETFPDHETARAAAEVAAREQMQSGSGSNIEYQDAEGRWHVERAAGTDRPVTDVEG